MPIESDKPSKPCKWCGKEFANLATHIINQHPSIAEQLEEGVTTTPPMPSSSSNTGQIAANRPSSSTRELIREKLEEMLDISIVRMLSKNPDMTPQEIQRMIEPPQQQTNIKDIIDLHNAIYPPNRPDFTKVIAEPDNTGKWLELASNALPMVMQMLPQKKKELEEKPNDTKHGIDKERSIGIRRLVPQQVTGNTGQSSSPSRESSPTNGAEQQNSPVITTLDQGT